MTRQAFFPWAEAQEERYEFDGSHPVAMTGGNLRHSRLARNINHDLVKRLAGKPYESLGPDAGVATVGEAVRYPDAVVTCIGFDDRTRLVPSPVFVLEVLSPSSIRTDRVIKLREYQAVPSIRCYVIVEQDAPVVTVYRRDQPGDAFRAEPLADHAILQLPEIDIELPLDAIYEGIVFDTETASDTGK